MKLFAGISLFILIIIFFSCEENGWFANCSDCSSTEPVITGLKIKLEENVGMVSIKVYEGNLEDSILYDFANVSSPEYISTVTVNKRYSVTATYIIDDNVYIAVDSATPKVKYTEDQCDQACYYVYDKEVDLRLKYTAK